MEESVRLVEVCDGGECEAGGGVMEESVRLVEVCDGGACEAVEV